MNRTDQLRNLPSVDLVLRCPSIAELRRQHPHRQLTQWVRGAIDDCRAAMIDGAVIDSEAATNRIVKSVHEVAAGDSGQSLHQVINATGVLLHTNLGRAPLADRAIRHLNEATRYANVELNLGTGSRSKRGHRVCQLLAQLVGADQALVVNNCAAATMLVLQSIASGRGVVISRSQLIEIGGGFRLPDVFRAAGVTLQEVGTTNRTYCHDYQTAIGESTGAIIRVHRSNFHLSGFVSEPTIDQLVPLGRANEIPVIDDLGSGCIEDLSPFGLSEPTVPASVQAGADLTLFSGDKLFGGPQCGIIVGNARTIAPLRNSPLVRAMRVDKLTLAALEATTEIHLAGNALDEIPVLSMLAVKPEEIQQRCVQLKAGVAELCDAQVVDCESVLGGGSLPGSTIASHGLKIACPHSDRLAALLRQGCPAILSRISENSLLMDLRSVAPRELPALSDCLRDALLRFRSNGSPLQ